jgi:hypothetical protein
LAIKKHPSGGQFETETDDVFNFSVMTWVNVGFSRMT